MKFDQLPSLKGLVDRTQFEDAHKPMFSRLNKDIPAGVVVFLVALPLCLGIALASGAPLISGLISGVIGGLVIGYISQSGTSVSGPAASVSAVVLVAIGELGSFEVFLVSLVIAGLIQVALGILKAGLIAEYIPTSIIKGLLAAIGIILILSQLPYAVGLDFDKSRFIDLDTNFFLHARQMVVEFFSSFTLGAIILTVISLFILIFWESTPLKNIKLLPPALIVVILGVVLNTIFRYFIPGLYLDDVHLVSIPKIEHVSSLVTLPEFSAITNPKVWVTALTLAVIASLSTLLNVEATDNIDPHKRKTPPNRELLAQGIGNTLAGLIGGIAITSVIVRSTVNISAGAQTKLSAVLHGVLLLVSVLFLSSVMNLIPLASLAAILLVVGYKLASIDVFRKLYKKGWNQFLPFVVTIVAILLTDVLIGVLIGSALSVFFLLRGNYYNPFFIENTKLMHGEVIRLELSNEVSFLNKASIKNTLWRIPDGSKVVIDASYSSYIDQDVLEVISDFEGTFSKEHDIEVTIVGLKEQYDLGSEITFSENNREDVHENPTPTSVLNYLKEGNKHYLRGHFSPRGSRVMANNEHFNRSPLAVVLNCVDCRESLDMVFNTETGELVSLKTVGNVLTDQLVRSTELVCQSQGVKLIVLLGHSDNQLIKDSLGAMRSGSENTLEELIAPMLASGKFSEEYLRDEHIVNLADAVTRYNLAESEKKLLHTSDYLRREISAGNIGLVSAHLDRKSAKVEFSDFILPEL